MPLTYKEDLEQIYDPLCDIVFIVNNECRNGFVSETGLEFLIEAVDKLEDHAKKSPWFIEKKKEELTNGN